MTSVGFRPPNQVKKQYAPRVSESDWKKHKRLICQLHDQQTPRTRILSILRNEFDFQPSAGQLNRIMEKWALSVYAPREHGISSTNGQGRMGRNASASNHRPEKLENDRFRPAYPSNTVKSRSLSNSDEGASNRNSSTPDTSTTDLDPFYKRDQKFLPELNKSNQVSQRRSQMSRRADPRERTMYHDEYLLESPDYDTYEQKKDSRLMSKQIRSDESPNAATPNDPLKQNRLANISFDRLPPSRTFEPRAIHDANYTLEDRQVRDTDFRAVISTSQALKRPAIQLPFTSRQLEMRNRECILVEPSCNYPTFLKLWRSLNDGDLYSTATLIADFLCAARLYQEAFEIYYRLLCSLVDRPERRQNLLASTVFQCLKTASTVAQHRLALKIAKATLPLFRNLKQGLICLQLDLIWCIEGLEAAYGDPRARFVDDYEAIQSLGGISTSPDYVNLQRQRLAFELKNRLVELRPFYGKSRYAEHTLTSSDIKDFAYEARHFVATSSSDLEALWHRKNIAHNLLGFCERSIGNHLDLLGRDLKEFVPPSQTNLDTTPYMDLAETTLLFFLLDQWERQRPMKSCSRCSRVTWDAQSCDDGTNYAYGNLFEALAAMCSLIFVGMDLALRPGIAMEIFRSASRLMDSGYSLSERFFHKYWSRNITLRGDKQPSLPSQASAAAVITLAGRLDTNYSRNVEICHGSLEPRHEVDEEKGQHHNSEGRPNKHRSTSPGTISITEESAMTSVSAGISMMSLDSGRRSKVSWKSKKSYESANSKRSGASNAWSIESRDSWRLGYYLPGVPEESGVRERSQRDRRLTIT